MASASISVHSHTGSHQIVFLVIYEYKCVLFLFIILIRQRLFILVFELSTLLSALNLPTSLSTTDLPSSSLCILQSIKHSEVFSLLSHISFPHFIPLILDTESVTVTKSFRRYCSLCQRIRCTIRSFNFFTFPRPAIKYDSITEYFGQAT